MKICQLLASRGDGGLEKHVRELSVKLVQDGHEVVVIADHQFLATLPAGIEGLAIPCCLGRLNPLLWLNVLHKLRLAKADIIHAQANKAASLMSILRAFINTPVIGTVHNIKRHLGAFRRLNHIITVSQQLAMPFPQEQVSVVYNGIEPCSVQSRDLTAEFDLPASLPVLFAAGRLVEAKGFDLLLQAINGLPVSLLIAGEGPMRPQLEAQLKQLDNPQQIRLLGQRQDITSLMAASDAVLISSRREGFSYVFNEALMMGCRVLATNVPVANEVLPQQLLSPVADVDRFRANLIQQLADMNGWSSLMQQPQRLAWQRMTLVAMAKNTVAVYRQTLAA